MQGGKQKAQKHELKSSKHPQSPVDQSLSCLTTTAPPEMGWLVITVVVVAILLDYHNVLCLETTRDLIRAS